MPTPSAPAAASSDAALTRKSRGPTDGDTPLTRRQLDEILRHFEHLEAQFQKVREGLTHSHRLTTLGMLTSIIAHEYNNILTPIISYAQLALARPDDAALMRKAVEKALGGAERAARISGSLLGFAQEQDSEHAANVRQVIDESVACLGREPAKDGIQLIVEVPDDLRVLIAPLNLQQVLVNLIVNARKAMRRKGGVLRITARVEQDEALIDVRDTGPGIPQQVLERLFEPFVTHRIDEQDDAAPKGTGLGLCICRDLLRNAGGNITATSNPGGGAMFTLRLPVAHEVLETT